MQVNTPGGWIEQAQHSLADSGFARTALANQTKRFTLTNLQADPVYGANLSDRAPKKPASNRKVLGQVLNVEYDGRIRH